MTEIAIDITQYDKIDSYHLQYFLDKISFLNPLQTLKLLATTPLKFMNDKGSYCKVTLTRSQNSKFISNIQKDNFHSQEFGAIETATHLLAFSFGENPDVNDELAFIVQESLKVNPKLFATVQWEIAEIIKKRNPALAKKIYSINLDDGQTYITTAQVIDKFFTQVLRGKNNDLNVSLLVVAQAWHAPRCIRLCQEKGLNVVTGRFSERFSPNDPQPWVRNAFSWVLKEGTK